jgi:hypothetical protein
MSSQPPKDFLALTHGHEWVDFYESFDQLVQDHLSRSSELLQKAMSLPDVADREVAELRETLERQLKTERSQANETLKTLRSEIANTQQQAVSVAALTAQLAADLEKLSDRVNGALASLIDSGADIAASLDYLSDANDGPESAAGHGSDLVDEFTAQSSAEGEVEAIAGDEGAGDIQDEATRAELSGSGEAADIAAADNEIDLSALAAAETGLPIEEIEQKIGTGELGGTAKPDTGDLASILEATEGDGEFAASGATNGTGDLGQIRSRPHWLSMTRPTGEQEPN